MPRLSSEQFMRPGIRCAVALLIALGLSACVSTETITADHSSLAKYRGDTITTTVREKPAFAAMTAGKAAFGLIGAIAMTTAGNDIVRKDEVPDPAAHIAQVLLGDLASNDGLTTVGSTIKTDSTDTAELAQQYAHVSDLLLDVQTINWSYIYFPANWHRYHVIYSVKLRLIDTRNAAEVAEGFCARVPSETPDAPTGAQLLANGGAVLKQQLATSADYCIQQFKTKVLQEGQVAGSAPASPAPARAAGSAAGG